MSSLERIMAEFGRSVAKGDYSRLNVDAYTKHVKDWVAEEIIGADETPAYSANTTLAQQTWFEGRKKQRQEQLKRLKDS